MKKGNLKSKSEDQISVIKIVQNIFDLNINLNRDYSILQSESKYKAKHGKGLKILTPKQMLQRVPIVLAQVKADNTSENLLSEYRKIIYSLYQAKEITKIVYNNIMNSIKL